MQKGFVRAGIKPGESTPENLNREIAARKVRPVELGDFEFAAGGRLEVCRQLDDIGIIEIQSGHRIVGLRFRGLLFKRCGSAIRREGDHAITFRVTNVICEHRRAFAAPASLLQTRDEVVTVKDVVAEDQSAMAPRNESAADNERLGQAIRAWLHLVLKVQSPLMAIAE